MEFQKRKGVEEMEEKSKLITKEKIGLCEQIHIENEKKKDMVVDIMVELSKPWLKPNTDYIICSAEIAEVLNNINKGVTGY